MIDRVAGRHGHNLRRRIALAVGLFTLVAVVVFGTTVWLLVAQSLQSSVDTDLRATARIVETLAADEFDGAGIDGRAESEPPGFDGDDRGGFLLDGAADAGADTGRPPVPYIQVLDPSGGERRGFETAAGLPISDGAVDVAVGQSDEHLESIDFEGRSIRMLTVPLDQAIGGGALQIGSDVTNITDGLRRARAGTILAGLAAGIGAAAMAWLFSRRLIAPVTAVADAADRLRVERELPERLDGEGSDELGRLIASFNAMLDDVRDSRTQQRRLVADASHELRTPLTSLRIKIEFVQSKHDLPPDERQRLLDGAVADLQSLGDLVSELVELAADGATPEQPQLIELAAMVEDEATRFATTSGRAVEVSTTAGLVETRPKQVIRALTNLLINADKYSPPGRPIIVTQSGPRIEVRDHGPGIPAEDRERAFDRFYRGKAHQSIDGSGLGLAIVESMAKANQGRAWIQDPDDGGPGAVVGFTVGPTVDG